MSNGTYQEFRDALRAFESGWDRERYDNGIIADWQLNQWSGGTVSDFYPQYTSWSQLSDAEWNTMSYRSMNSLGFVGYQFGEALLIDLGYYDDTFYYGNGAASNTWDGTWTGKNGVTSLNEFMTAGAQEIAIQEAFGFNLQIIQQGLGYGGESLNDYLGTTRTYLDNGVEVTVTLTLTGIMAAAHLRGAYGTLNLLQSGSVTTDEYGTSILRYVAQFGGYDSPSVDEAIQFYNDRITGDEGLGTPGGTNIETPSGPGTPSDPGTETGGPDGGSGTAGVDSNTADVVITWAWGANTVISGFNPATGTIFIDWIGADFLEITETAQGVHFAVPSNNQTTTLQGVSLSDLSPANFTILDTSAETEVLTLIGADTGTPGDGGGAIPPPVGPVDPVGPTDPVDPVDPGGPPDAGPGGESGGNGVQDVHVITWNWAAKETVTDFVSMEDLIDFGSMSPGQIFITEAEGNLIIEVLNNGGHTVTFNDLQAEDLKAADLIAAQWNTVLEADGGVYDQLQALGFNDPLFG